jgi:hypothetical protein
MGGDSDPVAFDRGSPKVRHPSTGGERIPAPKKPVRGRSITDLYKSAAYVSGETRNAHGYPKPEPQKRFEAAPITSRVCRRCRDFGSRPTSTRAIWQVASWAWTTPRKRSAVGCLRRTAANFRGSVERGPSACGGLAVLPKVHPEPVIGVSLAEIAEIPLECTPLGETAKLRTEGGVSSCRRVSAGDSSAFCRLIFRVHPPGGALAG